MEWVTFLDDLYYLTITRFKRDEKVRATFSNQNEYNAPSTENWIFKMRTSEILPGRFGPKCIFAELHLKPSWKCITRLGAAKGLGLHFQTKMKMHFCIKKNILLPRVGAGFP